MSLKYEPASVPQDPRAIATLVAGICALALFWRLRESWREKAMEGLVPTPPYSNAHIDFYVYKHSRHVFVHIELFSV